MTSGMASQDVQNSLLSISFASSPSLERIQNTFWHMLNGLFQSLSLLMAMLLPPSVAQFVPPCGKRSITPNWTILWVFLFFSCHNYNASQIKRGPFCHPVILNTLAWYLKAVNDLPCKYLTGDKPCGALALSTVAVSLFWSAHTVILTWI